MDNLGIHVSDFSKICRICLSSNALYRPKEDSFGKYLITVADRDDQNIPEELLPQKICIKCSIKLQEIHEFLQCFILNDSKLKSIFKNEYDINNMEIIISNEEETCTDTDLKDNQQEVECGENNEVQKNDVVDVETVEIICKCSTCSRTFPTMKDLLNHERFNPKCNKTNKSKKTLLIKKRLSPVVKPLPAVRRLPLILRPKQIKKTLNVNESNTFLEVDCIICNRHFLSNKDLQNHRRFNPTCRKVLNNVENESPPKNQKPFIYL